MFIFKLGDSGYPLEPWLMTPMPNHPEGSPQYLYTRYHCKARNVVERFFGHFKSMWRCLSYQRVLMYCPDIAGCIVNACAVLHNMYISHGLPVEVGAPVEEVGVPNDINNEIEDRGGPRAVGERIRMQIVREKFPNRNLM